jgi:4-hydroxybenzoate polyprenyltransferase
MSNYLKLIRFPNLIIIALMQYVMRYFIIEPNVMRYFIIDPVLGVNHIHLQLPHIDFALLVLATVLMAAGGYIINDYFDTKADRLNKREVIVGRKISRRITLFLHQIVTALSILIGGYVSWRIGHWQFVTIFFMAGGLLWFYSTSYKHYFLLGSVLMSLLAAAIPFLVVIYEVPLLNQKYASELVKLQTDFNYLIYWIGAFSIFTFMGMLLAQWVRDLSSLKGDREIKRESLPLKIGMNWTKTLIVSLLVVLGGAVYWFQFFQALYDKITNWYFACCIALPLVLLAYCVIRFKEGDKFAFGNFLLRFVILAGISYAFVVNYILNNTNF